MQPKTVDSSDFFILVILSVFLIPLSSQFRISEPEFFVDTLRACPAIIRTASGLPFLFEAGSGMLEKNSNGDAGCGVKIRSEYYRQCREYSNNTTNREKDHNMKKQAPAQTTLTADKDYQNLLQELKSILSKGQIFSTVSRKLSWSHYV